MDFHLIRIKINLEFIDFKSKPNNSKWFKSKSRFWFSNLRFWFSKSCPSLSNASMMCQQLIKALPLQGKCHNILFIFLWHAYVFLQFIYFLMACICFLAIVSSGSICALPIRDDWWASLWLIPTCRKECTTGGS